MNAPEENKVTVAVEIFGQTYNVKGEENEEYIKELARYVDEKMKEINYNSNKLPPIKVAVLTALNMADELYKLKQEHQWLLNLIDEEKE